jgi:hypothetical protein
MSVPLFEAIEEKNTRLLPRLNELPRSKQPWRVVAGTAAFIAPFLIAGAFALLLIHASNNDSDTYFFGLLSRSDDQPLYVTFFLIFIGLIFLFISGYFFRTWKECQEATADEAIARDPRAPILYLRPFQADTLTLGTLGARSATNKRELAHKFGVLGFLIWAFLLGYGYGRKRRAEELIVDMLVPLGPVIAIGRPGESVPRTGASRLYVGDNWQDVIRDLMSRSQLIVMFGGTTPGFAWEVTEAFRNAPFVPTILLLPYFSRREDETKLPEVKVIGGVPHFKRPDDEVETFVEIFTAGSGLPMPSDLSDIRAMYFPSPGETVLIPNLRSEAEKSLQEQNPFLSSLGRILHIDDPDWLENNAKSAKEENASTKSSMRWLAFLVPLGLLLLRLLIGLMNS